MGACATNLQRETKNKLAKNAPFITYRKMSNEHSDENNISQQKGKTITIEELRNKNVNDANGHNIDESLEMHQKMMNNAGIELDLSAFENIEDDNDFYHCNSEDCNSLRRLLTASTYYSRLNIVDNNSHYALFDDFMQNIYMDLINDYVHFNTQHSHQIQQINSELPECDINQCKCASRHYETVKKDENLPDAHLNFYRKTMDSVHFYLYHCFHVGIRVKTIEKEMKYDVEEIKEIEEKYDKYFDKAFARMNKMILQTKHFTENVNRFSSENNSKFTIQTQREVESDNSTNITFLDQLYGHLQKETIEFNFINKLHQFVTDQEFDTETIEYDTNIYNEHGNIEEIIGNTECIQQIKLFISSALHSHCSFNVGIVGFRFYYWKFYKSLKQLPNDEQRIGINSNLLNTNEHCGYNIYELFIIPKYASFKQEISNYNSIYFSFKEYQQNIVVKVTKYQNAKIVKATKAVARNDVAPYSKHYGIKDDAPLEFSHLLSLILYCDYFDLSTDFSSSFRSVSRFEKIKDIKNRNSKYYYLSKYIRETVECYGQCRDKYIGGVNKYGHLSGPFYCGINILTNMECFSVRLCSPTSTSKQIEVATKFTGSDGIIVHFDNPYTLQYQYLRGFNVSFLSRYSEEREIVFAGGFLPIQIISVTVRNTNQNFGSIIQCLNCLDIMISGGRTGSITKGIGNEVSKHDVFVIKTLFDSYKIRRGKFNRYIYDTFIAYVHAKKQIVLDLYWLSFTNTEMRDLLMHRMYEGNDVREDYDVSNSFKLELLSIFNNVKTMIIKTTHENEDCCYTLSMIRLLQLIESTLLDQIIIKAGSTRDEFGRKHNWIKSLWNVNKEIITNEYSMKNYSITVRKECARTQEYWFVINKMTSSSTV